VLAGSGTSCLGIVRFFHFIGKPPQAKATGYLE